MKDGDLYVNEHGGRQSYVSCRMDLIPPENLLLLGQCLGFGAKKYGEHNWHQIPENENLNHALVHILKWLSGDRSEPHLVNTLARVNFALWHAIQSNQQGRTYVHPDELKANPEKEAPWYVDPYPAAASKEFFRYPDNYPQEFIEEGQTDKM